MRTAFEWEAFTNRAFAELRMMSADERNGIIVNSVEAAPQRNSLVTRFSSRKTGQDYSNSLDDVDQYMAGWNVTTPEGLAECLYGELEEVALAED